MIIDINCWTGAWGTHRMEGEAEAVRDSLCRIGVDYMCMSPLAGVWDHNPHVGNGTVYEAADRWDDVLPVPIVDPTIATWPQEVDRARRHDRARLVKWLPNYGRFDPDEADECAIALREADLGVIVQVRLEDARRQHPLAVVHDADPIAAVRLARRHPGLTVIIGGASWTVIHQQAEALGELGNLHADVSQADGMDTMRVLGEAGVAAKLLFGTHAPFFVPLAGLARVVTDLDDALAAGILGGNAAALLKL